MKRLFAILCAVSTNICYAETTKETKALNAHLSSILQRQDAIKKQEVVISNGVRVESMIAHQLGHSLKKTDLESLFVNISHPNLPTISVSLEHNDKKASGIGIFQKGTGQPNLTLSDRNGDGVFDLLTYSVLDAKGNWLFEVEDYGMDGQADFKLNLTSSEAWVFYEGKWRKAIGPKQNRYIKVGKEKIPLNVALKRLGR